MSELTKGKDSLVGFCSAPWTDCISYADGALKACDRNPTSFGNWQTDGLKKTWESEKFQEFRKAVAEGRYPDTDCASCHNNGTQRTAESSLAGAVMHHREVLGKFVGEKHIPILDRFFDVLPLWKKRTRETDEFIDSVTAYLDQVERDHAQSLAENTEFRLAVTKFRVITETFFDYLAGELKPRRVATFRQSQLQAKCTARCIMCAGKYTGEIVDGPTMDEKYVDEAFAEIEDVTDFWCNGAEYLYYKEWRKIATMLASQGVKLRVSTNGILLTEPTIKFMVDNKMLRFLTMSLDAATKQTMESTRINVNFDKNMERIRYLLQYAHEHNHYFEFTAAFVMMKRNLEELPAFIRLIHSLRPQGCRQLITILLQPLENFDIPNYRRFVHGEHHVLLGEKRLREIILEARQAQLETGVAVTFYNQKLGDFIDAGMPFPKYFPRRSDVDLLLADFNRTDSKIAYIEEPLAARLPALQAKSGSDRAGLLAAIIQETFLLIQNQAVLAEIMGAYPDFAGKLKLVVPTWTENFLNKLVAPEAAEAGVESNSVSVTKLETENSVAMVVKDSTSSIIVESAAENTNVGRKLFLTALSHLYVGIHHVKSKLIGNRKSLLLWKLSVIYRNILGTFGLRIEALPVQTSGSEARRS